MGGEPWTFTPTEIGLMTDRQIWDQYVRPAVRRARGANPQQRRRKGDRTGDGIPSREAFVTMGVASVPGTTTDYWGAEYDTWAGSDEGRAFLADREERKGE